ncbi:hypothetical protein [Bdellovibrio sp.]|uniref:hypothetical protein n=1 Tax=Bdellovibrio TaxID=958 RepID=UPI003221DC0B
MRLYTSLVLSGFLALSACAFKKDDGEKTKAAADPAPATDVVEQIKSERAKEAFNGQLNDENVQVSFKEAEMGRYQLTIAWPTGISSVMLVMNGKKAIIADASSTTAVVEQGAELDIELTAMDSLGAPMSVYTVTRKAPVDIILSEPYYLREDTNLSANRLYLLSGGYILTNGRHLNISVNKMYVEEAQNKAFNLFPSYAKIRTQNAQNIGSNNFEIRNSSISITAKKAVGTLSVAMVGFNGRNGKSGEELERQGNISRQRDSKLDGANGLDEATRRSPRTPDSPAQPICTRAAGNGQDGAQGAPGINGENGQPGGDTGNLLVTIDDFSEFSLEVGTQVGHGGKGASGSPGHEGGNGGAPGKTLGVCAQVPTAGKKGPKGADGTNGVDGQSGKVGTISSNVSKQNIFDLNVKQNP